MRIHSMLRPTSVITLCNYSLLRSVSIDIQLAPLWDADPINGALSKTHIKIYIYQFQESIFNVVHQVMVSLGSRKRQGQNICTSMEQCALFFSLGEK